MFNINVYAINLVIFICIIGNKVVIYNITDYYGIIKIYNYEVNS